MARKIRVEYSGAIYHVTARGNGRQNIFISDDDRVRLLKRMVTSMESYGVRLYLYCLMTNHIHLLLETPSGNLSRFMQSVMTGYGVYFNLKHNRAGHVFQGRFGARLVEGNEYLYKLSRYVHLNPVRCGGHAQATLEEKRERLRAYPWSSYRAYIGLGKKPDWLSTGPVLAQIGGRRRDQAKAYRRYVEAGLAKTDEEFRKVMQGEGSPIGTDEFSRWVEEQAIKKKVQLKHPEDVDFRHKAKALTKAEILIEVGSVLGLGTDEIIKRQRGNSVRGVVTKMLIKYGGMTGREVARVLGMKFGSGISWQLAQLEKAQRTNPHIAGVVEQLERAFMKRQKLFVI